MFTRNIRHPSRRTARPTFTCHINDTAPTALFRLRHDGLHHLDLRRQIRRNDPVPFLVRQRVHAAIRVTDARDVKQDIDLVAKALEASLCDGGRGGGVGEVALLEG